MAEYLLPGLGIFNDASGDQYLIPGLGVVMGSEGGPAAYSLSAGSGSVVLNGKTVTLLAGNKLQVGAGSFALSGSSVTFHRTYRIRPGSGSFGWAGTDAALARRAKLGVGTGTFAISGTNLAFCKDSRLVSGSGDFVIAGQPATIFFGDKLTAEPGATTITGQPINFLLTHILQAGAASIAVSGQSAALKRGLKFSPQAGSVILLGKHLVMWPSLGSGAFHIQGQTVNLRHPWTLQAGSGSIILAGQNVFLGSQVGLAADPGALIITGFPVIGFPRTYCLTVQPRAMWITGSDRTQFKTASAPHVLIPIPIQGPRSTGSSMSSRGPSSVSHRGESSSQPRRGPGDSIERRPVPVAVPIGSTSVIYVDRYVYVDGSMITATVFEKAFAFGDATPQPIFALLSGAVIAEVNVWILETFDGAGSSINIGRSLDPDELMDNSEIDPSFRSSFSTRPGAEYSPGETVNLTINPGAGCTQGRGVLSVYII